MKPKPFKQLLKSIDEVKHKQCAKNARKVIKAWILHQKGKGFDAGLVTTQFMVSEWHRSFVIDCEVTEVEIRPKKKG